MELGIVGRGRLGTSLTSLLRDRGVAVDLVGRERVPRGEVVLLCVPDDRIEEAARALPAGPIVLHASGTAPVDRLAPHRPRGSFHPLMTFPGPDRLPDLEGVPAALAGDSEAVAAGRELASRLSMRPIDVPGDRRLYHAAAVLSGNFATVLLGEAARVLAAAGVHPADAPSILAPLALQSIRNAARTTPAAALTGPVARGDRGTLDAHRRALVEAGLGEILEVYEPLVEAARRLKQAGNGEPPQT